MIRTIRVFSVIVFIAAVILYFGADYYVEGRTDREGPSISMEEQEIAVSVEAAEADMLSGVYAQDKKDGDVTSSLVIESLGAFVEKGKRQAVIAAFDSDGNIAKAKRTVCYRDYTSPRISLSAPLRVPVNGLSSLMNYIKVSDCIDGDITDNLQITMNGDEIDGYTPGEYSMKLTVSNSAGDTVELPVTVECYESSSQAQTPLPLLSQYLVYTSVGKSIAPASYLKGVRFMNQEYLYQTEDQGQEDEEEAALPVAQDQIKIEGTVDYNTPGVYEICYTARDENGNQGSVRLIVIVEE